MFDDVVTDDTDDTDESLYDAWAGGDKRAGTVLAERYLDRIFRFFANKVTSPDDAADLVGTTWEKLIHGLGTFEKRSTFRTYVFGIANNVLRDYVKTKARRAGKQVSFHDTSINEISPTASVILDERKEHEVLFRALRRLPFELQVVIELSYFEHMTHPEIAKILDEPVGTIATRIRRGKELLRRFIEEEAALAGADGAWLRDSALFHIQEWMESVKAELDKWEEHGDPDVDPDADP